jgi:hypothetical protein
LELRQNAVNLKSWGASCVYELMRDKVYLQTTVDQNHLFRERVRR